MKNKDDFLDWGLFLLPLRPLWAFSFFAFFPCRPIHPCHARSPMSRAVVVHSSDARAPYWAPVVACLRRHVVGDACAVDVITEQEREPSQHQHPLFNCYPAGTADFASRLATYLGQEQASARFVLYTQDDFVFFDDIPTQLLQGAQEGMAFMLPAAPCDAVLS